MDAHNILYVLSGHLAGYPAGHFYSAAIDLALTPLSSFDRLRALDVLLAHADEKHTAQLNTVLPPHVREYVNGWRAGQLRPADVLARLAPVLDVLPALVVLALPQLADAIKHYAAGFASARAPRTWATPTGDTPPTGGQA